ncbi:MAG: type III pantothenate kinase [Clostridium sp.]|nr:type III pantothenate kinase [Clostridium sp.]
MNLVIDIGNTRAKLVAFEGCEPVEEVRTSNTTLEALPAFLHKHTFSHGILGSVIDIMPEAARQLDAIPFPMLRLDWQTPIPIRNGYATPQRLGADRLAAAVGAYSQRPGNDILIIDAGTCITYDFIDAGGCYRGGNIAPGLHMRLKALHAYTAKLPLVEAQGEVPMIGRDTETAIRSGVIEGMRFEMEGYIRHFKEKYPRLLIFLTGGDYINFDSTIKSIIFVDNFIVPKGLNCILRFNNDKLQASNL